MQMTCPHCRKEFPFNNGEIDAKISRLGQEYSEIRDELARYKLKSSAEKKAKAGRRRILCARQAEIAKELSELKAIRKTAYEQKEKMEYNAFKNIVRERYGDVEFHKILALVEEELKAYRISDTMKHEYTRSNAKANVTSINKL